MTTIFMKKLGLLPRVSLFLENVYCNNMIIDVQNESFDIEDTIERIISIALLCNDGSRSNDKMIILLRI